jgi:hypothetical protein
MNDENDNNVESPQLVGIDQSIVWIKTYKIKLMILVFLFIIYYRYDILPSEMQH